jgi:hypothetical protein
MPACPSVKLLTRPCVPCVYPAYLYAHCVKAVGRYTWCELDWVRRYRARVACLCRHQLNSFGFGLLNGRGSLRFFGLARGFAFVGPGMGIGLGLHIASPTTSLTRIQDFP